MRKMTKAEFRRVMLKAQEERKKIAQFFDEGDVEEEVHNLAEELGLMFSEDDEDDD